VSPKGHTTFTLASPNSCWYVDLTGSGNETISHLSEPGGSRSITLMWAAFDGPPQICRFWGKGRVFLIDSPGFDALVPPGDERRLPGTRAIIWCVGEAPFGAVLTLGRIDFHAVGTSCGFSIPKFDYAGERDQLLKFMERKEANDENGKAHEGMRSCWAQVRVPCMPRRGRPHLTHRQKNSLSVDDLAGPGQTSAATSSIRCRTRRRRAQYRRPLSFDACLSQTHRRRRHPPFDPLTSAARPRYALRRHLPRPRSRFGRLVRTDTGLSSLSLAR
jgi:hypothetical protein